MNSYELLLGIREAALEFDTSPISDELIMRKLNLCYTFLYSHIVKSDDSRFGEKLPFTLQATVTEYDLPKEAWGKRIEQMVVPYPSNALIDYDNLIIEILSAKILSQLVQLDSYLYYILVIFFLSFT